MPRPDLEKLSQANEACRQLLDDTISVFDTRIIRAEGRPDVDRLVEDGWAVSVSRISKNLGLAQAAVDKVRILPDDGEESLGDAYAPNTHRLVLLLGEIAVRATDTIRTNASNLPDDDAECRQLVLAATAEVFATWEAWKLKDEWGRLIHRLDREHRKLVRNSGNRGRGRPPKKQTKTRADFAHQLLQKGLEWGDILKAYQGQHSDDPINLDTLRKAYEREYCPKKSRLK